MGTVHGEKQPSLYFLCGPLPPRTQFHFQNRLSPFFAQLEAAGTFVSENVTFQFHLHNSPTLWIQPLKLCGVFGNTVAPGRKNTHLACSALHGAHSATSCPKCTIRQWGALTGHLRCIFFCPPATGYPGWRSGNARARCAGLRTPLGSCAARVRRAAESAAAPAADHGRVRDGWCYEHQCQMAPSRGRLRRARQPHLRQGTGGTAARARNTFITVVFH